MAEDKIITSLTPEQEAMLPIIRDKWIKIGRCTRPTDEAKAMAAFKKTYIHAKEKWPGDNKVIWVDSPIAGVKLAEEMGDKTPSEGWCYGQQEAGSLSFYDFFRQTKLLKCVNDLEGFYEAAEESGWWKPYDNCIIATRKPLRVAVEESGDLHHESEKALEYRDGWGLYRWRGISVPDWVITNPERITASTIDTEANIELRRVLLERFGFEAYLEEGGFTELDSDPRFGVLYQKEMPGSNGADAELLTLCRVVNSTPEPDGSFNNYALAVPPEMKTAHEAVAWSFQMTPEEYNPQIET